MVVSQFGWEQSLIAAKSESCHDWGMGFWSFIWNACWREASGISRKIQVILVTLPALAALTIGLFGGEWSKDLWPAWVWASLVAFAIVGSLVWSVFQRAFQLEKGREPKLTISDPIETTFPKPPGKIFTRFVSVEIENISYEQIRNCVVKEVRFTNVHGFDSEINGRIFRIVRERYGDYQTATFTEKFDLNGKGAKQIIDIAHLVERHDGGGDKSNVFMMYAANVSMGLPNSIPRSFFPHVITLQVEADNLQVPIQKTFKLLVSADGYLRMETKF